MRQRILKGLAVIVVLVLAVGVGGYVYLRRSLPTVNGTITVPGIAAPVEIIRDADNIPHIFAGSKADAFYGLGYAHAQDRLWQMEFQRRIGHGRLSEVFGPATLPQDRFLRTAGFGRAAVSAWSHLPENVTTLVNAYVAGVNAFLEDGRLPPEFTLLRFEPEPWTGPDVLVWVKMMAWDLSANYALELLRHDIARKVGVDRLAQLMPPYPLDGPSIIPGNGTAPPAPVERSTHSAHSAAAGAASWTAALTRGVEGHPAVHDFLMSSARSEALGSNSWVVDGSRTASGKPLLANDPHLGASVPSLWYLAHMKAGDFEVIGATLPGAPAVAIGRNRHIAWGETNVAADVQDLYRERLNAAGTHAEFEGAQEPLKIVKETIAISGQAPVTIDVRISRHGPLVSDAINANNLASTREPKPAALEPLAFRWTALDDQDSTITAFLKLNEAKNWTDFTAALEDFVVPSQNFVYADVDGHIGYYAPGRIPIRASGDGSMPAEGWTGAMEWTGWIPFEALPHTFDPPGGAIVSANHRPAPPGYPHLIGLEFPEPYRAMRISELVGAKNGFTPEDFRAIQADTFSTQAKALLPLLLTRVAPASDLNRRALEVLRQWDLESAAESAGAAIFQAWFINLAPAMAGDELGPQILEGYQARFSFVTRFVVATLSTPDSPWCDDVSTGGMRETCAEIVNRAFSRGVGRLADSLGDDPSRWRWSAAHRAVFPHQGLDTVGILRPWLSRSVPSAGDWSTINVGPVNSDQPFDQTEVPGYRQIVDLSPANDSRFSDSVGQSGHFLSPHYDDALEDWRQVRHKKMRLERAEIEAGAIGTLTLREVGSQK
jgi:penicillin amidase